MNITLMTDKEVLQMIASRAKKVRISNDFRQIDLSQRSGVPLSSIRVFERSGVISFVYLIKLLRALSIVEELDVLFKEPEIDLKLMIQNKTKHRIRVKK